ncbi:unnamed protein product [Paramecium octaurelia]|uniref:Uncharacterized protein n=1 Tax=Paramecium octaurelia TaxID=43137 RepID=A0A8S1VWI3_PAROT|nr:unnamed protein product [Paramecium octaurelia]
MLQLLKRDLQKNIDHKIFKESLKQKSLHSQIITLIEQAKNNKAISSYLQGGEVALTYISFNLINRKNTKYKIFLVQVLHFMPHKGGQNSLAGQKGITQSYKMYGFLSSDQETSQTENSKFNKTLQNSKDIQELQSLYLTTQIKIRELGL